VSALPTMEDWLAAAVSSRERLSHLVGELGPDEMTGQSFRLNPRDTAGRPATGAFSRTAIGTRP
jgi:hypothetical protein